MERRELGAPKRGLYRDRPRCSTEPRRAGVPAHSGRLPHLAGRAAEVAGAWPARARSPEQHGRGLAPLGHTWPGKAFTALRLAWPGGGGGGGRARQAAVMLACLAVAWRAEERVPCRQAGGQAAALAKLACQGRHWQLCMHVRVRRRCCREGAYCSGTRTGTRGIILWHALVHARMALSPSNGPRTHLLLDATAAPSSTAGRGGGGEGNGRRRHDQALSADRMHTHASQHFSV